MRQLQRWLHQHIFKVGWLLTKNFHTTTILYYTIFLPGVVLYEVSYWLVAGILNVRADRAISWPEKQEIAELRFNFVKLHKSAGPVKVGIIALAPLVIGIVVVWHIATNVINVDDFLETLNRGGLDNLGTAIGQLTSAPDFWLWVYVIFAISNTMLPDFKALRGLRIVGLALVVAVVGLFLLGIGDVVVLQALTGPIASALNVLAGIFAVMIAVNLIMTGALGLIESIIERVTGDSATFVKGKLVAMTREEILAQRAKEAEQARKARVQAKERATSAPSGPPSVYKLSLPIPGPPGKEAISQSERVIIETEKPPTLQSGAPRDDRAGPAVITGAVTGKPPAPSSPTPKPGLSSPQAPTPVVKPPALPPSVKVEEPEEDEGADDADDIDDIPIFDELKDDDQDEEDGEEEEEDVEDLA